eukprot:scaffold23135_cov43-Attheya_sp.AAC.3
MNICETYPVGPPDPAFARFVLLLIVDGLEFLADPIDTRSGCSGATEAWLAESDRLPGTRLGYLKYR